jgi:hypothetical protein
LTQSSVFFLQLDFVGGGGSIPWELIAQSIDTGEEKWFYKDRYLTGAAWGDPGSMSQKDVLLWLSYLTDKTLSPDRKFQFKTTLSSNHPSTIPNPQYDSFVQTKRREQDVWALTFTQTVTACQLPGGMRYAKESWAYGSFLATGKYGNLGVNYPPEWQALPPSDPNRPTLVFREEEISPIRSTIDALPVEDSSIIYNLINATNLHESKIPASVSTFVLVSLSTFVSSCSSVSSYSSVSSFLLVSLYFLVSSFSLVSSFALVDVSFAYH